MPEVQEPVTGLAAEALAEVTPAPTGRLWRLQRIERSVVEAKLALGEAEATMRSVHAGLALEPMPGDAMPAADTLVVVAPEAFPEVRQARFFDVTEIYRSLPLALVPRVAMVAALMLTGWWIAVGIQAVLGTQRFQETLASLGMIAARPAAPPALAAVVLMAGAPVPVAPATVRPPPSGWRIGRTRPG